MEVLTEIAVGYNTVLGVIETKIVGMQYVPGDKKCRSVVYLERQHDNQFDQHAIIVTDQEGRPVGYLRRTVASWLAPL